MPITSKLVILIIGNYSKKHLSLNHFGVLLSISRFVFCSSILRDTQDCTFNTMFVLQDIIPITTGFIGGFALVYSFRHILMHVPSGHTRLRATLNMPQVRDLGLILQQTINDVPGVSYQDKLNHLANCDCCERHQVNKPTVFVAWHETPSHNTQGTHPCMCNCRHVARFICRQADGYNPPHITRSNTPLSVLDM